MNPSDTPPVNPEGGVGHTPGPWVIVPYGDGDTLVIHYGQSQQRICFMATPSSVTDDFPRIKANARLIAAAPALYEALEYLVSLGGGDCLDPARDALALAKGGAL